MLFFSISIGLGKHWFFLIRTSAEVIETFDSLGTDEEYIRNFIPYNAIYEYNTYAVQCNDSELCGSFVLYFLILRYYNLDGEYEDVLNEVFSKNCKLNEQRVQRFLRAL